MFRLALFFLAYAFILQARDFVPYQKSFFNILSENDAYFNPYIDYYYTAGTLFSFTSKEDDFSNQWLGFLSYGDERFSRYDIALRQYLYTPISRSAHVNLKDHPYAGFLSLDFTLSHRKKLSLENIKLQIGMVGPAALADKTQKLIHILTKNPIFYGWDTQIKNEFILNLHYEYIYKYDLLDKEYFGIDMLPSIKIAFGNANTFASIGGRMRWGYNLFSDFGIDRIGFVGSKPFRDDFSLYVFGGVLGSYVARNIFIQGNSYGSPRELDLMYFLYDVEWGLAILYKGFRFSYTIAHQGKQFRDGKSHTIGSIMLNFAL